MFRLCVELGCPHPDELILGTPPTTAKIGLGRWFGKDRYLSVTLPGKPGMTALQLNEWFAFSSLEPVGREFRAELRHGQSQAMVANLNRDTKNRHEPFTAVEFMNFTEKPPVKVYSEAELEAYTAKMFGG